MDAFLKWADSVVFSDTSTLRKWRKRKQTLHVQIDLFVQCINFLARLDLYSNRISGGSEVGTLRASKPNEGGKLLKESV